MGKTLTDDDMLAHTLANIPEGYSDLETTINSLMDISATKCISQQHKRT
jgi:hypothetical protein